MGHSCRCKQRACDICKICSYCCVHSNKKKRRTLDNDLFGTVVYKNAVTDALGIQDETSNNHSSFRTTGVGDDKSINSMSKVVGSQLAQPEKIPKSFLNGQKDQDFKVSWKDHHPYLIQLVHSLLERESLVDVTLAAEGQFIRVHRLILGACSHYFEELLCRESEKQAIIFLKDVTFADVKAVVDFMYKGEVNVPQDQLQSFLSTAQSLRIKGLEFDDPSESSAAKPSKDAEIVKKDEERTPGFKSALPLKERSSTGPRTKKKKIAVTDPKNKRSSLPAPKVVQAEEKKETKIAQAEEKKDSKTAQAEEKKEGKIAQTEEKKETKVVQAAEKKANSPKSHKKAPSIVEDIELLDIDIDMDVDPLDRNKNEILAKPDSTCTKDDSEIAKMSMSGSSFAVVPLNSVVKLNFHGKEASPAPEVVEIPPVPKTPSPDPQMTSRRSISSTPSVMFNCELCTYSTPTNFNLKMHMKKKHQTSI